MKVRIWGARGSIPTPGPETTRYGGNTSCVEVRRGDTLVVLDAGSGIRRLSATLDDHAHRIDLFLTHLHMDHIIGLGFFAPFFRPGLEIHLWGPASTTICLRDRIARYLSPPLYPVRVRDFPCALTLHEIASESAVQIDGITVESAFVCHKGPTLGFRLTSDEGVIAYLPDHEPALGTGDFPRDPRWTSGYDLARGADLLLHDSQYDPPEYADRVGWGHSSVDHACLFAALAEVNTLVPFHHDPERTDDDLDAFFTEVRSRIEIGCEVVPAREDLELEVGR